MPFEGIHTARSLCPVVPLENGTYVATRLAGSRTRSFGRGSGGLLAHRAVSRHLDIMSVIDSTALPGAPLEALSELARTEAELDDIRRHQVC